MVDPVMPSSSDWFQPFARSVRRKGKLSLEIVVPSPAFRSGPVIKTKTMNVKPNKTVSNVPSLTNKSGGKSTTLARSEVKSSSPSARGVGVKSSHDSSSSSSATEDEDSSAETSCRKHQSK